jgi:flagellar assembly factor FliW
MTPAAAELEMSHVIDTRFGRFSLRSDSTITFAEGLPAFEKCRRFVLLSSDDLAPLWCLQSLDAPEPCFLAVDPSRLVPRYQRSLSDADRARIGDGHGDLIWLALVTVGNDEQAVVNLRAPVVIDCTNMIGVQVIQASGQYQVRHPLKIG